MPTTNRQDVRLPPQDPIPRCSPRVIHTCRSDCTGLPEITMQAPIRGTNCRERTLPLLRRQYGAPRVVSALGTNPDRCYWALSGPWTLPSAQREQEVGTTLVPGEKLLASQAIAGPGDRLEAVRRDFLLAPFANPVSSTRHATQCALDLFQGATAQVCRDGSNILLRGPYREFDIIRRLYARG